VDLRNEFASSGSKFDAPAFNFKNGNEIAAQDQELVRDLLVLEKNLPGFQRN
jgi:hypothetical protein